MKLFKEKYPTNVKKGLLLTAFCLFFTASPIWGAEVLARRLSISFQNTPIKQALDEVARLADFEWSYNTKILEPGRRVTFTAQDWSVREILREMLGEEYTVKSNGQYLILKRQKPPKTEVSGVIRATNSGERLANVTVYDRKTLRATTTDSSGYYHLKVKKKTELVVVRLGFRDTLIQVASLTPRYQNLVLEPVPVPPSDSVTLAETLLKSFRKAATEVDYFFDASLDKWHDLNVPDTLQRRFQLSFLPILGTNHVLSRKVENNISINILAGQSAGVRAFEAAGLGNFTQNQVTGVQMAGLFNLNRGSCSGLQAAGLYNRSADTLQGMQLSGLINVAGTSTGFAIQAAGLINKLDKISGVQASGLINKADKVDGAQIGGLLNLADSVDGAQISGLINTAEEINGLQIAGLFNKTTHLRGIQIGVFNQTKSLEGIQIGLLNRSGKRWVPFFNFQRRKK